MLEIVQNVAKHRRLAGAPWPVERKNDPVGALLSANCFRQVPGEWRVAEKVFLGVAKRSIVRQRYHSQSAPSDITSRPFFAPAGRNPFWAKLSGGTIRAR